MKQENGQGTIYKLKGHHHRPWVVRVTTGWKLKAGKAVQIRKQIGSFATRDEAREALATFHKDPYLPEASATLAEIFDRWWEGYQDKVEHTNGIKAGFRYLEALHDRPFNQIRPAHIEGALKDYNQTAQKRAKTVLNHLYQYAMKNELVEKNYASFCELNGKNEVLRKRTAFSDTEIETLWQHEGEQIADMVLIQIYSGWRPAEMFSYRIDQINGVMIGGSKTDAGRERVVPIHPAIAHLVEKYADGFGYGYTVYWRHFKEYMASLGMDHIPHECRHTFATLGKRYGMDEYILKRIIGHAVGDLTEEVYTHRSIEDLKTEIAKIKVVGYVSATQVLRTQNN